MVSSGILNLATVSGIMEEVASSWFTDEPIYGSLCLLGQLMMLSAGSMKGHECGNTKMLCPVG